MHVFSGKSPASARFKRGEPRMRGQGWQRDKEDASTEGEERAESSTTRTHRRGFSYPLAHGIFSSSPSKSQCRFVLSFINLLSFSVALSPDNSLRSFFPFRVHHPRRSSFSRVSRVDPKEEMCLCLDSRQIICGNKFLCV